MRIYALLLLLVSSTIGIAQSCNNILSGKVIDFHDGSPLMDTEIHIQGTDITVFTDFDGNFSIKNLCQKTYSLLLSHIDCDAKQYTVKVTGNTTRTFRLEHHLEELNEVIVVGNTYSKKSKTILESKISGETLDRFSSGSLGDALNSLSGVSSLNTGNTINKPLINGLHSSRVTILNHGVIMEDQEWGSEHAPNIDINTAGHITLIKGASALQYSGDAVGGVIVIEPSKVPIEDDLYGKTILNAASNGRGGTITTTLTKSFESGWYTGIQGTFKRFGDFEAPDYILSNTGISERNASLRFGLNRLTYGFEGYYSIFKNEAAILRSSHIGGAEDQVIAINSSQPIFIDDFTYDFRTPKQDVTHHLARLHGFKRFEKWGKLSVQYDYQNNNRLEFDNRRGDDANKPAVDLELKTHTLKLDLDSKISDALDLKSGIITRYQDNFADPATGVRRLIPDYKKFDLGIYGIADYRINEDLLVELGARFDYSYMDVQKFYRTSFWEDRGYDELFSHLIVEDFDTQLLVNPELDFSNFSGTLGGTYSINDKYTLFFNYSLASRVPNPSELFSDGLHYSSSRIEIGDLRFDSEIGHKLSLALKHGSESLSFSVNPYLNIISNFIVIEPVDVEQTIRGNFQVWEYRQTDAQLIGVDIDASYKFTEHFLFNHQFSLVKGNDLDRKEALINMPPVTTTNEIIYQNSKMNNLRLGLKSEYVFRQNEFPDNNFEVFIPQTQTFELVDVSTPPDAYHLVHFNSSMSFSVGKATTLQLGFDVTNIFNTSYRNYLNRLRYYADDLGRNFLVNIKINY